MSFQLVLRPPLLGHHLVKATPLVATGYSTLRIRNCLNMDPQKSQKLVLDVKERLEREYTDLPVGRNGRDDEEMILWFLKDRKFSVDDAVSKLHKAIRWRHDFGVSDLSEESVKSSAETGKAYVHDNFDVNGRPVLIVDASKHFPQFDVFYYYYPRRLSQVLFVDAPFVFKPLWQLVKPMLKQYASLVRFCSAKEVREEYFTEDTLPASFRK
ncbi:motile sperm domain-containing protein 2 isoform X2 [Solanum tuberosum]|uniref:motile sperm domain-containing protein 2 isoform X2 n=1 Tax=Solanum tuberosum TaxID=4113 RepID=UPI0003D28135|nr:PREDICTED: motile sperm domain-containing protein 2 isoform X2 [Solanum tuberosum]